MSDGCSFPCSLSLSRSLSLTQPPRLLCALVLDPRRATMATKSYRNTRSYERTAALSEFAMAGVVVLLLLLGMVAAQPRPQSAVLYANQYGLAIGAKFFDLSDQRLTAYVRAAQLASRIHASGRANSRGSREAARTSFSTERAPFISRSPAATSMASRARPWPPSATATRALSAAAHGPAGRNWVRHTAHQSFGRSLPVPTDVGSLTNTGDVLVLQPDRCGRFEIHMVCEPTWQDPVESSSSIVYWNGPAGCSGENDCQFAPLTQEDRRSDHKHLQVARDTERSRLAVSLSVTDASIGACAHRLRHTTSTTSATTTVDWLRSPACSDASMPISLRYKSSSYVIVDDEVVDDGNNDNGLCQ